MRPLKPAEMQEANLTSMVLFLKRIDIAGLGHCDFMNRPGSFVLGARGARDGPSFLLPGPSPKSRWPLAVQAGMEVWLVRSIFPFRGKHFLKEFFNKPLEISALTVENRLPLDPGAQEARPERPSGV